MTYRTRSLMAITFLLAGAILLLSGVLTWASYQAILRQQQADAQLLARLLARTVAIVAQFPQEMESAIGEQMVVEATLAAHLVAIAEQAGLPPEEINQHLKDIVLHTTLSEFWITDEKGHSYLRNIEEIDFTFNPDPAIQPQASAFWPLLTGEKTVVIQEARVREVDSEVFKYVGVAGIDKPRIVQVGYNATILSRLRSRVGLERLIRELVQGGDITAIRLFENQIQTFIYSALPEADNTTISPREFQAIQETLEGKTSVFIEENRLKTIAPVIDENTGTFLGSVIVYFPIEELERAVRQQILQALILSLIVLLAGGITSVWMSSLVIHPLQAVMSAARQVEKGNYSSLTLEQFFKRSDEVGELARIFNKMAQHVTAREQQFHLMQKVIPIGVSLSAEKDFNRLLETLVIEAQELTHAEGGTLYLLRNESALEFVIMRNEALGIHLGGTSEKKIEIPPIPLYTPSGIPDHSHLIACAVFKRIRINLPDAYLASEFDLSSVRRFDEEHGYRTVSILTIPLPGSERDFVGVLQLVNARDRQSGKITSFTIDDALETLILLASAAVDGFLRQEMMRQEIARLRIEIDEAKRTRQVAEIVETDYFRLLQQKAKALREKHK